MEALPEVRQVLFRNAGAGIAHAQHCEPAVAVQAHGHFAGKGELERIRQEVEYDLLPHLRIDVRRLPDVVARDHEPDPGALERRTEHAGEIHRQALQVDGHDHRPKAACLQPREIQKAVDELGKAQCIPLHDLDLLDDRGTGVAASQELLQRTEHECQRRAEFVADVREECRLGAIELGQRFRAQALRLVGLGGGEGRADLAHQKIQEAGVGGIERAIWIDPRHEHAGRFEMSLLRDRQQPCATGGPVPGASRRFAVDEGALDRRLGIEDLVQGPVLRRRESRIGSHVRRRREHEPPASVREIGQAERHVARLDCETALERGQHLLPGLGDRELRREVAQQLDPPLADDPLGLLRHDAQHSLHRIVVAAQGAVGEGVIGLLTGAAAFQEQQQALVPSRRAGGQHALDARTDVGPDLFPDVIGSAAEHPVALDADRGQVSVVAKERQLRSPGHPHGVARVEHHPHHGLQALGPRCRVAQRRRTPVQRTHARAHLAPFFEERQWVG